MIANFNEIALWITSSIVSERRLKKRVGLIHLAMDLLEMLIELRY